MSDMFDAIASEPTPAVRATDPDTSREAVPDRRARTAEAQRVHAALVEIERTGGRGATAHEIVMHLSYSGLAPQQNCVARRLTDLAEAGLIADSGERRPGGTGRRLIVWAPA